MRSPWSRRGLLTLGSVFVAALAVLSACESEARSHAPVTRLLPSIEQAVTFQRDLRLEENQLVINVSTRVKPEAGGGFLVADALEQQLRLYAADGRLLRHFGRRGSGPGEFHQLSAALRLNDGTILAGDFNGRLTRFDSAGTRVLRTSSSGLGPIYEMLALNDSVVVIVGRKGGQMRSPLVHEWNVGRERITRSFFAAPQGPPGFSAAYAFTGFATAAVRGDTVAVVFALQDTVRLYVRGREIEKLPLHFRAFRRLAEPLSPDAPPPRFQAWLESFSAANGLYWLQDGSFLIQYLDQKGSDRLFSLLHMRRNGEPVWEAPGTPRLLALSPKGSLVFVKRGAEAPNEWSIASLSAGR